MKQLTLDLQGEEPLRPEAIEALREYFATHIHRGHDEPFEIDCICYFRDNNQFMIYPKIPEGIAMVVNDIEFGDGIREVGRRFRLKFSFYDCDLYDPEVK